MGAEFVFLCQTGNLEGVRAALQRGVDVNRRRYGWTGLMEALRMRQTAVANLLLQQEGLDVDIVDDYNQPALHFAAESDQNSECLAQILSQSTSVNQKDMFGYTALWWAVSRNAVRCVQLLLSDKRTDTNTKDDVGDSPLMIAVKWNDVACVELLLADPRVDLMTRDNYQRSEEEVAR